MDCATHNNAARTMPTGSRRLSTPTSPRRTLPDAGRSAAREEQYRRECREDHREREEDEGLSPSEDLGGLLRPRVLQTALCLHLLFQYALQLRPQVGELRLVPPNGVAEGQNVVALVQGIVEQRLQLFRLVSLLPAQLEPPECREGLVEVSGAAGGEIQVILIGVLKVARQGVLQAVHGGAHARRFLSLPGPVRPLRGCVLLDLSEGSLDAGVTLAHPDQRRFLLVVLVHHGLAQGRVLFVESVDLGSPPFVLIGDQLIVRPLASSKLVRPSSASSRYPGSSVST